MRDAVGAGVWLPAAGCERPEGGLPMWNPPFHPSCAAAKLPAVYRGEGTRQGCPDRHRLQNEILTGLNKPEEFLLAIVEVDAPTPTRST